MQVKVLDRRGDEVARYNIVSTDGNVLDQLNSLKEKLQQIYPPLKFRIRIVL